MSLDLFISGMNIWQTKVYKCAFGKTNLSPFSKFTYLVNIQRSYIFNTFLRYEMGRRGEVKGSRTMEGFKLSWRRQRNQIFFLQSSRSTVWTKVICHPCVSLLSVKLLVIKCFFTFFFVHSSRIVILPMLWLLFIQDSCCALKKRIFSYPSLHLCGLLLPSPSLTPTEVSCILRKGSYVQLLNQANKTLLSIRKVVLWVWLLGGALVCVHLKWVNC